MSQNLAESIITWKRTDTDIFANHNNSLTVILSRPKMSFSRMHFEGVSRKPRHVACYLVILVCILSYVPKTGAAPKKGKKYKSNISDLCYMHFVLLEMN